MRPNLFPFLWLGDVSGDRTVPFSVVPDEGPGTNVRAVRLALSRPVPSDRGGYWTLEVGTLQVGGTRFDVRAALSSSGRGWATGHTAHKLSPEARFKAGETIGVRFRRTGEPVPLVDAAVALIYATEIPKVLNGPTAQPGNSTRVIQ